MPARIKQGYVDPQLSTYANLHTNESFIAEKILPLLTVGKETGKVKGFSEDHLRSYNLKRAYGSQSKRLRFERTDQAEWKIDEYDLEDSIDYREEEEYESPYSAQEDSTTILVETMKLNMEIALASMLTSTGIITNNETLTGQDQWSDYDNSDPLGDIERWMEAVRKKIGRRPNRAWMGSSVLSVLKFHPDVVDRIKYVGQLSQQDLLNALASLVGLKEIHVGESIQITSKKGQTVTKDDVWGRDFGLYYQADKVSKKMATFGFTVRKTGGKFAGSRVVDVRDQDGKLTIVRCTDKFDQLIADVDCAFLGKNVVASV